MFRPRFEPIARTPHFASLVGEAGWARLPLAVRQRFGDNHASRSYSGQMDFRCSALGRVFAGLACLLGSPLVGRQASGLATQVRVQEDGQGGVVWERRIGGPGACRLVRSTKAMDEQGRLVERTEGGLCMSLSVSEQDGALVFESHQYFLCLGPWQLIIPSWLSPGPCLVTHRDLGQGSFRFALEMRHPLWGLTFQQTGVFADPI